MTDDAVLAPKILMEDITKSFGNVHALQNVCFNLCPGEIRALVGENGAGKSTLMNILYGMYSQDSGDISIDGEKIQNKWSPSSAISKGIGMIHQHFSLIYNHSVLDNIVMPTLKWSDFKPDWKKCEEKVQMLLSEYHFNVTLKDRVGDLSIGERQQVEILKALYQGAKVLILDEPTGVLTPQQSEALFRFLIDLRSKGYSVVLVTHKLNEAMQISDKITVLRGGKNVGTIRTDGTTISEIARMMVDREMSGCVKRHPDLKYSKKILELKEVSVENGNKNIVVDNICLTVGQGEIVGIAGVAGNGQIEMAEAIVGLRNIKEGSILLDGIDIKAWNVEKIRCEGIGYIPEDRHENGMIVELSIAENLVLDCMKKFPFSKNGIIQHKNIKDNAEKAIINFNVKTENCLTPIKNLSGGNQQKVVLARTLMEAPKIIIACQPTRGLDFSATDYIKKELVKIANKNVGVLLISSDLDELFELSDRIIVLYRGKIMGNIKREEVDLQTIGLMMTGCVEDKVSVNK